MQVDNSENTRSFYWLSIVVYSSSLESGMSFSISACRRSSEAVGHDKRQLPLL